MQVLKQDKMKNAFATPISLGIDNHLRNNDTRFSYDAHMATDRYVAYEIFFGYKNMAQLEFCCWKIRHGYLIRMNWGVGSAY